MWQPQFIQGYPLAEQSGDIIGALRVFTSGATYSFCVGMRAASSDDPVTFGFQHDYLGGFPLNEGITYVS